MTESKDSPPPITSAIDPVLGAVRQFIADMLSRGAVAALVTSIVALLVRMRDLNAELMRNLAPERKPPTKRGPKTPHPHGRPKLPDHLQRVPQDHLVPDDERECPGCEVEAERIGFKTAEKLDVIPAHFIVRQVRCETVACQECHEYVVTACKGDEVLDRGILGDDLLVEALVDHYDDAVPYERMERNARQEGVPLAANTLASSVGRVIDLFDPSRGTSESAASPRPSPRSTRRACPCLTLRAPSAFAALRSGWSRAIIATPASSTPRPATPSTSRRSSRDAPCAA